MVEIRPVGAQEKLIVNDFEFIHAKLNIYFTSLLLFIVSFIFFTVDQEVLWWR